MTYLIAAQRGGVLADAHLSRASRAPRVAALEASAETVGAVSAATLMLIDGDPRDETKAARASRSLRGSGNLRPADPSLEAFVRWWGEQGGEAGADLDEIVAQWQWMTERCKPEAEPAQEPELEPVIAHDQPKPPAEPEPAPVAPKPRVEPILVDGVDAIHVLPGRARLPADEAALRFVDWIRLCGRCGPYNSQGLADLYREHCLAEDLVELPDNVLRPALRRLAGDVTVEQRKTYHLRKGGDRHRRRNFTWTVHPVAGDAQHIPAEATVAADEVVPWPELRMRRVA